MYEPLTAEANSLLWCAQ